MRFYRTAAAPFVAAVRQNGNAMFRNPQSTIENQQL